MSHLKVRPPQGRGGAEEDTTWLVQRRELAAAGAAAVPRVSLVIHAGASLAGKESSEAWSTMSVVTAERSTSSVTPTGSGPTLFVAAKRPTSGSGSGLGVTGGDDWFCRGFVIVRRDREAVNVRCDRQAVDVRCDREADNCLAAGRWAVIEQRRNQRNDWDG